MKDDWITIRRPYEYHVEGRYSFGEKQLFCDRSNSFGTIAHPSCFKNPATKKVTIRYDEHSRPDYLVLCDECAEGLRSDVRRHGYKLNIERLSKSDKEKILEYSLR